MIPFERYVRPQPAKTLKDTHGKIDSKSRVESLNCTKIRQSHKVKTRLSRCNSRVNTNARSILCHCPAKTSEENLSDEGGTWLPDGYSQIFRSCVFGPSGFWTMAPLRYAAKLDPFLSLDCAPTPSILAQSKERKGSNFAIWQP